MNSPPSRASARAPLARTLLLALAGGSALIACQTPEGRGSATETTGAEPAGAEQLPENPAAGPVPYDPRVWDKGAPDSIGVFLAGLDKSMRAWTNLTLTAQTQTDRNKARRLQEVLMREVHARQQELVDELESGPPRNRAIAAGALGFSASKDVQGPLLVGLGDKDSAVVQNSALSLALLENPETPMEPLLEVMRANLNGKARANAAYAVRTILEAGAPSSPDVVKAARSALFDQEPFAQAQAALIVAVTGAGECIPDLAEALGGREPLVVNAATQALVALGRHDVKLLGPCGRALVTGLGTAPEELQPVLQRALVMLSGQNFGEDEKAWSEWAQRLP